MRFTSSQWDAVRSVDRHVLVAAGAGTGKTNTVVGRILYLLGVPINGQSVTKPLALRDLAAITFTNAAAADLKRKIREALRSVRRYDTAYLVDTARMGTIHSFCSDVLREVALRTGGNPGDEIVDEVSSLGLMAQVARDSVVAGIESGSVEGLDELLETWSVREVERFVTDLLRDLDRLRVLRQFRYEMNVREAALVELAGQAAALMDRCLEDRGQIDFDRIVLRTRDALASDRSVLEAIRRRIRVLIVDEFQDVDPVQQEIAYLVGDPESGRQETPRLMLVGDPKQSIYRFRRADVTVWSGVERDFRDRALGMVVTVAENFRSDAPILGFVDATIGKLLDQPADGERHRAYEVRYEQLRIGDRKQATGAPVELLVVPTRDDGKDFSANEVRAIEAGVVAQRARALVDTGECEWGDMAVIIPTWSTVRVHREALERVGGRVFPLRTGGFYEQREIVDLLLALETIRDPLDDRALFGLLRSPFVGLKDETLLDIARQNAPPYWLERRRVQVAEQERWEWGRALLERHVAMRDRVPIDELLESVLDHTGYVAHLSLLESDRPQAVANVDKFLRQARAASRQSLGEFLRAIADVRKFTSEEGDLPVIAPKDAVTITTVHSAKGLQWNVVFWCDMVARVRRSERRDLVIGRRAIALKDPDVEPEDAPARWQVIRDELAREDFAERKRVWYVAATRAAHRLFVCGLPAGGMRSASVRTVGDHLWQVVGEIPLEEGASFAYEAADGTPFDGLVRLADPGVLEPGKAPAPGEPEVASVDSLPGPLSPISVPVGRMRHSATELLAFSRCPRRHWFKYVVGVREPEVERDTQEFIDAVTRGNIVHDVLEHLLERDELDRLLEDAIHRCDPDAPPPEQPAGQRYRWMLRDEIERVADHPDYRAIADLPTARRELQFVHIGGPRTFYEGGIDLGAQEGRRLVLLDVKASRAGADETRRRADQYRPQRAVYVAAAEGISGLEVERFAFQFSRAGLQISHRIGEDERHTLPEELAGWVDEIGRGVPRLTAFPAECRFCGYKRVGWCPGVEQVGGGEAWWADCSPVVAGIGVVVQPVTPPASTPGCRHTKSLTY